MTLSIQSLVWRRCWWVLPLSVLWTGCGPAPGPVCQQNQAIIWDAAGNYCLDQRMVPNGAIDPQQLKKYFGSRGVPRCPLGTTDYSPFRLFDGPKCPHAGSNHGTALMPRKVAKIKEVTQ